LFFADWVQDKIRSKFALQGICWKKSFIPKLVWQVGDSTSNIIESLHADANSEGTSCTLVGGVKKGQHFDKMKLQSLEVRIRCHLFLALTQAISCFSCLREPASDLHTNVDTSPKTFLEV
jgi:hypothetical protein